jgi:hypothetical protein
VTFLDHLDLILQDEDAEFLFRLTFTHTCSYTLHTLFLYLLLWGFQVAEGLISRLKDHVDTLPDDDDDHDDFVPVADLSDLIGAGDLPIQSLTVDIEPSRVSSSQSPILILFFYILMYLQFFNLKILFC